MAIPWARSRANIRVSLNSLRTVNSIDGDQIRIGQVLTIPES